MSEAPEEHIPRTTAREPKWNWFEPAAAVLMAVATLGSAWCSYQASQWSRQSGGHSSEASRLQRLGAALQLQGIQLKIVDTGLFMQAMNAKFADNGKLLRFYEDRFTPQLKAAYTGWLKENPLENPGSAPHPFVPGLYQSPLADEAARALTDEARENHLSGVTGGTAEAYLSNTLLLATVLFFAGTSRNFDKRAVRFSAFAFGLVIFLYCFAQIVYLPPA